MEHKNRSISFKIDAEQKFMISSLIVNAGNYLYNLILGRVLGPELFAEAALLITFLLVLSFVAMTFQLVTAKFSVILEHEALSLFIRKIYTFSTFTGIAIGVGLIVFSSFFQNLFHTTSSTIFVLFGFGVPLYFLMSVNRGRFQGTQQFSKLAFTYQTEMWSRLLITVGLIWFIQKEHAVLVSIGIIVSLVFGLFPLLKLPTKNNIIKKLPNDVTKQITQFFIITAFYECTQIIVNNSDILLVKHFFETKEAGLYASLALIGRVVYFVAWMFVMLLLPTVIQKQKEGKPTTPILLKYLGYIGGLALSIVLVCFAMPQLVIKLLFGKAYLAMAPLLWQYATATALFALSNLFAYYFLSLNKYIPVIFSGILGIVQVMGILVFHESLYQVVVVQIIVMSALLVLQLGYFFTWNSKNKLNINHTV